MYLLVLVASDIKFCIFKTKIFLLFENQRKFLECIFGYTYHYYSCTSYLLPYWQICFIQSLI
jgi:hypothetical protein